MPVDNSKFSNFQDGGDLIADDIVVGLRDGVNTRFNYAGALPPSTVVPISQGGTGATTASAARTNLGLAIGVDVQAWSAVLDALSALAGTGFITQTGASTFAERTHTGTTNQIDIANGDGVSGNPTYTISSTFDAPGTFTIQGTVALDAIIDDDTMATATATNIPTSESVVAYVGSVIGGAAGGSNGQMQYNNAGAFGGDSGFTTDGAGNWTGTIALTGQYSVDNLTFNGNTISSATATDVIVAPANGQAFQVDLTGGGGVNYNFTGAGDFNVNLGSGFFILDSTTGVDRILDEDNMASDSATGLATQQSIKAYVDGLSYLNAMTNGQLLIGRTGLTPTFATLTAGSGISIANASGAITISGTGGGYSWTEVTGTSQAMAVNNGYIANNAGLVTLTLPATASVGDTVTVQGKGAGLFRIAQNAGQTIHFGSSDTTTGAGGYLEATQRYDSVELLCITANTDWAVYTAPQGVLTVA